MKPYLDGQMMKGMVERFERDVLALNPSILTINQDVIVGAVLSKEVR